MKNLTYITRLLFVAGLVFGETSEELARRIIETRGEPLRELPGLRVVNVRDFGAIPDDGTNDFVAIQAAVKSLGNGYAELRFEPGVYEVDPGGGAYKPSEAPVLFFQGLENVVVDGQGATILIQRPSIGFSKVRNCTNVILRNFKIDYDPLPVSQGRIVDTDVYAGWIEVETDDGYPALNDPFFESYGSWGMLKDPVFAGKLKNGAPNVLFRTGCTEVAPGRFRLSLEKPFADFLAVGDRYAQVGRAAGGCEYYENDQVTFDSITFYAAPGSLFVGSCTSHLNVLNCRGKLKKNRLLVNGADGVHCQAARVGPWVEGCEFEGLSDDCINIYSIPLHIRGISGPHRFSLSHAGRVLPGDRLAFFCPQTGAIIKDTVAVAVDGDVVTVKHAVKGLNTAPDGTAFDQRGWKIYDHVYNVDATGNHFVYRNNHMHDGRRFGGFIKASYGLIENNRFERLSDNALMIQNEPGWPEGFWARNLVIRNNRMLDCAFRSGRIPLQIDWQKLGHQSAALSMQQNIYFESNLVRSVSGPVAEFKCVDGLTLIGNTFESGSAHEPAVAIEFSNVWKNENNTPEIEFE